MNGEHPTGFWVQLGTNEEEAKYFQSARGLTKGACVNIRSMRSSCWRTSREMVTVRFRTVLRAARTKWRTYYERFVKLHGLGQSLCRGGGLRAQRRPFRVKKKLQIGEDHSEVCGAESSSSLFAGSNV